MGFQGSALLTVLTELSCHANVWDLLGAGARFSKTPETFQARKAVFNSICITAL